MITWLVSSNFLSQMLLLCSLLYMFSCSSEEISEGRVDRWWHRHILKLYKITLICLTRVIETIDIPTVTKNSVNFTSSPKCSTVRSVIFASLLKIKFLSFVKFHFLVLSLLFCCSIVLGFFIYSKNTIFVYKCFKYFSFALLFTFLCCQLKKRL